MATVSVQITPTKDAIVSQQMFDERVTMRANDASRTVAPAPASAGVRRNVLDMLRLDGKVAVITGGARGLGYSMAEGLCAAGLSGIAIIDLQSDLGEHACKQLHVQFGGAMDSVVRDLGRIDIAILSAGIADIVHAEEYSPERFRRVIDVNLNGSFFCAQAAGKQMIAAGRGGSIIFVGSMSGSIVNWPNPQCAYNSSKAGVIHLMKSLSAEWAKHRIRCNSISPGYMDTPLNTVFEEGYFREWKSRTPMGRLGQPEELAGCALWLASEASSFCTGSDILIDGGYTVL
ncbi:hypothetical protein POJ06DRAFT_279846 [Lipomyces tetrasporus]|uniref:Uncharacterized protein n=1 Tax=Lipomyces tetrasporus TaxID=54092 RepID=A0AAD7QZT7_9ASCO|nr:uncharacterized protein POJ06DRAFT_279846 [Lipomyces tetrasporus]KAJ8104415.1 hypothetical protein POJ06DRAFT_279846 [Lipomyces tetrasporus]